MVIRSSWRQAKGRFRCELLEKLERVGPAEKGCRWRGFPRWLVGDDEALVAALRRESATEVNEG
jgi:hypothetical protein